MTNNNNNNNYINAKYINTKCYGSIIRTHEIIFAFKDALMRMRAFGCFAPSSRYVTAPWSAIPHILHRELTVTQPNLRPRHCILYCAHYLNERNFAVILPPSNPLPFHYPSLPHRSVLPSIYRQLNS